MRMLRNEPFKYDSYKALRAHLHGRAPVRQDAGASVQHARVPEEGRRRRAAVLRAVQAARPRQGQERDEPGHAGPSSSTPTRTATSAAIFGACWQGVAAMKAFPHKDFGIKRKDRRQLQGDPLMFSKLFYYVAQVLNVPLPEVYLVEDNKAGRHPARERDREDRAVPVVRGAPAPAAGQDRARDRVPVGAPAHVHAARVLPEACCCRRTPSSRSSCSRAIVMLQPRFPVPPDMVAARSSSTCPRCRSACRRTRSSSSARSCSASSRRRPRSTSRSGATRSTRSSHRAGFVVCGDLEVAARMVVGRAGRRRRAAGEGQDQGARAVLDQRGVLRGPRPDGPDDRRLSAQIKFL